MKYKINSRIIFKRNSIYGGQHEIIHGHINFIHHTSESSHHSFIQIVTEGGKRIIINDHLIKNGDVLEVEDQPKNVKSNIPVRIPFSISTSTSSIYCPIREYRPAIQPRFHRTQSR